ncbi:MAG TPA: indolepyruvate oxidoreductase subunit beta [Bacteroidales bacterium]|nr:indolepyruvate oxidoreductase subunit beta [Bacteroidales bacterium]
MKKDIIIAGVGGQGILSIAATIGLAAVEKNMFLKQSEVHGMSQRGGDVVSHLRISDKPIHSDLIPYGTSDLIISVEPMEALRHLPWLAPGGWIVTNSNPYVNISDYPPVDEIIKNIKKVKNSIIVDADSIAADCGSVKAANMVILGAASPFMGIPLENLEDALKKMFSKKGEQIVEINLKAFRSGRKIAEVQ